MNAVEHIGKAAEILQEAECYIKKQTEEAYKKAAVEDSFAALDIPRLLEEDVFIQKQLLLYFLEQANASRKDIGAVHVEDMLELARKQGNGELSLPGGITVRKSYRKLMIVQGDDEEMDAVLTKDDGFFYSEEMPLLKTEIISLSDKEILKQYFSIEKSTDIMTYIPQKAYTKWFDYDKIETSPLLRHRKIGDYLTINAEMERKSIKNYMIQEKIPAQVRDKVWLFVDGAHVIWIPGGRISAYYKVTEQTKTILQAEILPVES